MEMSIQMGKRNEATKENRLVLRFHINMWARFVYALFIAVFASFN